MKIKATRTDKIIEIGLIFLSLLSVMSTLFYSNSTVDKIILLAETLVLCSMGLLCMTLSLRKIDASIFAINLVSLTITLLMHNSIGSILIYFNSILCMLIFNNISITKKTYIIMHSITGVLLAVYLLQIEKPMYVGNVVSDFLGNRMNTNMIGIWYLACILHLSCAFFMALGDTLKSKLLFLLVIMVFVRDVIFYDSRTTIICMLLYLFMVLVFKNAISYKKYETIVKIMLIASLIFPIVYLILYSAIGNFEIMGKSFFSGRQFVWQAALEQVKEHPVIGGGNNVLLKMRSNGHLTTSVHNTLLGLWKINGLIPLITFIYYFVKSNKNIKKNQIIKMSQFAVIATLPLCFFESFYTEATIYMYFLTFLIVKKKD